MSINRERAVHGPIPIDVYRREFAEQDDGNKVNNIYLIRALNVAEEFVKNARDGIDSNGAVTAPLLSPELYESVRGAAWALTTSQCLENHKHPDPENFPGIEDDPAWEFAVHGLATPDELVGMLARYPDLNGLELARFTHIGRWLGRSALQLPILESLQSASEPSETQLLVELGETGDVAGADDIPAYYELWFDDPRIVVATRKRIVAEHSGIPLQDEVLLRTIESSSMIIVRDSLDPTAAETLQRAIDIHSGKLKAEENPNGERPGAILHSLLEPHFDHSAEERPSHVIPYMTTYFTASTVPRYLQ